MLHVYHGSQNIGCNDQRKVLNHVCLDVKAALCMRLVGTVLVQCKKNVWAFVVCKSRLSVCGSWMQLAGKADLSRLEQLEQQVDNLLNDSSTAKSKQVCYCAFSRAFQNQAPDKPAVVYKLQTSSPAGWVGESEGF